MKNKNAKNNNEGQQEPSCCRAKQRKEPRNVGQAILYGLIPHAGCIAFIIGSVLGVTVLTQLFKPLLMSKNFFYILILISLLLATISSVLYLRKTGFLSAQGIRKKWKYLSTMYGVTIGVNLLLFLVIFPLLANVSTVSAASSAPTGSSITGSALETGGSSATASLASLTMKVAIPCPGHAPLISNELKAISGVQAVKYSLPNRFEVTYDPAKTSKDAILSLAVFQEYTPTVLSEFSSQAAGQENVQATAQAVATPTKAAGGCGCGGGGSVGGSTGGGCGGAGGGCGGCGEGSTGSCGSSGAGAGTCSIKY